MSDFIERDTAIEAFCSSCPARGNCNMRQDFVCLEIERVQAIPAADVRPVVYGEWVREMWFRTCSKCGATTAETDDEGDHIPDNFCPNCGADMRPREVSE